MDTNAPRQNPCSTNSPQIAPVLKLPLKKGTTLISRVLVPQKEGAVLKALRLGLIKNPGP